MNYPDGVADRFEYILLDDGADPQWNSLEISGSWFPEAFIGTMASLMRYSQRRDQRLAHISGRCHSDDGDCRSRLRIQRSGWDTALSVV